MVSLRSVYCKILLNSCQLFFLYCTNVDFKIWFIFWFVVFLFLRWSLAIALAEPVWLRSAVLLPQPLMLALKACATITSPKTWFPKTWYPKTKISNLYHQCMMLNYIWWMPFSYIHMLLPFWNCVLYGLDVSVSPMNSCWNLSTTMSGKWYRLSSCDGDNKREVTLKGDREEVLTSPMV